MKDFFTKTVWIVGASSGIGEALAEELSARGARLILSARRKDKLDELAARLGLQHRALALDVTKPEELEAAAASIGHIDSAIFLAAAYKPGLIKDMDLAAARTMLEVNLMGAFNFIHALYPRMSQARHGQLVLCGSVAGYCGLPNSQPYSATKAGLMNLAQSLYTEAKANGVDVKLISPGFVRTPMTGQNDFAMPMMIEPKDAARAIAGGLLKPGFEIHFPKKFTRLVKLLAALPYPLFFRLSRKILEKKTRTRFPA